MADKPQEMPEAGALTQNDEVHPGAPGFIYGVMEEAGVREEVRDLWILESCLFGTFFYMFFIDMGTSFNRTWRQAPDLLPPEAAPLLDLDDL